MKLQRDAIQVMGILNVTPDSFSDGGRFQQITSALLHAEKMIEYGVDIIDIGGESTRPGASKVSIEEEIARVIPLLRALRQHFAIPVSIDTSKPEVMRLALQEGADMINDVYALQAEGALAACQAFPDAAICLMHMQGLPQTMQQNPQYQDILLDIQQFFQQRINACEQAGIAKERLCLDPGFGFGKTLEHNISLLQQLAQLQTLGLPLLVGLSRKSMIGALLANRPVKDRIHGSVGAAVIAAMQGANIVRVHDVKETVDALQIVRAVKYSLSVTPLNKDKY